MIHTKIPEVLAPAGDFERLKAAVTYGADAVYLAGKQFGMRASQTNFDEESLVRAVEYCHAHGVRVYLTVNILPRNEEIDALPPYLCQAAEAGVDAMIVSDLGTLSLVKRVIPQMEIHISTQTGIVNYETANVLYEMGAKRVVLARELSLREIAEIRRRTPPELEIEAFVHGAMCMSFSGRCVISNYLTGRDANRGECAQPCRWGYHLMEEKRPGLYFPVFEDEKGSYILNAKDLCMIEYIDALAEAGITSFKIEGRAKSSYYVSVVTNAYRIAVDDYLRDPAHFSLRPWLLEEVTKVSHRQYSTGFYFGTPEQYYQNGGYIREYDIVALVSGYEDGRLLLTQKNKFCAGDTVEVLEPGKEPVSFVVSDMKNAEGEPIDAACHPEMMLSVSFDRPLAVASVVRKAK